MVAYLQYNTGNFEKLDDVAAPLKWSRLVISSKTTQHIEYTACISGNGMWRNLITGHPPNDDVIKWKHFPRYWPFVRGIHQSAVVPAQRPVTRSFDVFFDLHLNKRLSEQSWGWWFGTPSHPFWRHYDVLCFRHLLRASPVPRDIPQSTGLISSAWIGDRRH